MASTAHKLSKSFMLIGQCVPCVKANTAKFKIKRLELDTNLLMYFRKEEFLFAHDPKKQCKTGDMVLIQELPQKLTRLVTHEVVKVVHPLGDIVDPITGKKCVVGKYRDDIDAINELYGKVDSTFDYNKAPPRGWQEDKKDFTHRDSYIKYHVFENDDQPYAV